jgi:hypothetical protein
VTEVSPTVDLALSAVAAGASVLALVIVAVGQRGERRLRRRVAELERSILPRPPERTRHSHRAPETTPVLPAVEPETVEAPALPRPGRIGPGRR